jgi:hypothetical protein
MEKPRAKSSKRRTPDGRTWTFRVVRRVGKLARELGIDIEVDLARRIVRVSGRGATSGKPSAIGNDLDDWMAKRGKKDARQA